MAKCSKILHNRRTQKMEAWDAGQNAQKVQRALCSEGASTNCARTKEKSLHRKSPSETLSPTVESHTAESRHAPIILCYTTRDSIYFSCLACLRLLSQVRRRPTSMSALYRFDGFHGLASRNGKGFPIAYAGPKMPPSPPVLPMERSITCPMVYLVTSPSSENLSEHACGGVAKLLPVGLLPRKPAPLSVPEACDVNQILPDRAGRRGSGGSEDSDPGMPS